MNKLRTALVISCLCLAIVACSEQMPSVDPADVIATLTTNPTEPQLDTPVKLYVEFEGIELKRQSSSVSIEVRIDNKSKFVEAKLEDTNRFIAEHTFDKSGEYEIFVHLYTDNMHITKKQSLEVQ